MSGPVRDGRAMVAGMRPELRPGRFLFCAGDEARLPEAFAMVREEEGLSLVLPEAAAAGLPTLGPPMRLVTLRVHSALDGVGLTAAVATALAGRGIACNVVAGLRHDHLLVPADRAEEALACLEALSEAARA